MASLKAVEAWSDRSIQFLAQWIVAHPWRSMLMSLVIVLGFSVGSGSFIYSLDHRAFFGAENPQLKAFEKSRCNWFRVFGFGRSSVSC